MICLKFCLWYFSLYLDLSQLFIGLVLHCYIVKFIADRLQRVPQPRQSGIKLTRSISRGT